MQKDILFIIRDWNSKVGSQETPGVTGRFGLGVQNEAGQKLIRFCQENALVIANTLFQQHKRRLHIDITRWSTPKSDYVLCSQRWRSSIQSAKTRLGADCGSDHELLIAKVRMKLQRRQWHPTPVFLPGESHRRRNLVQSIVSQSRTRLKRLSTGG